MAVMTYKNEAKLKGLYRCDTLVFVSKTGYSALSWTNIV